MQLSSLRQICYRVNASSPHHWHYAAKSIHASIHRSIDWLIDRLIIDWLIVWLNDRLIDWLIDWRFLLLFFRLRQQFVDLLHSTPYALPGRSFRDVCIFLATEPSYTDELKELNAAEKQDLYEAHQRKITEDTKDNFLELLWEHVALFQPKLEARPVKKKRKDFEGRGRVDEDSLTEIEHVLRADKRYRAMDLLPQRDALLRRMWMYFQSPFAEPCLARGGCFDSTVKTLLARSVKTYEKKSFFLKKRFSKGPDNKTDFFASNIDCFSVLMKNMVEKDFYG